MLKPIRKKRKSKANLLADKFVVENSNFKTGTIEISTKEKLKRSLRSLNEISGLPKKNQQFRIITRKSINSFDFILAVLGNEEIIEEMIIAFYRIGKKVINEIGFLISEQKIKKVHFLINDGFPKLVPDAYNLLKSYENEKWKVCLDNNHTKIICLKTNKNNFYVIEGSGNLSINARIEQYVFDNDKKLYDFHKSWITKIK